MFNLVNKKITFFVSLFILGLAIFLYAVFSSRLILQQTFSIGVLNIHYYGIIMALAVASAFYLALKRSSSFGLSRAKAEDTMFWLIIDGFIGARLYHVLSSASYYFQNPVDILKVWNGGLSIYGAVIGGLAVMFFAVKILHLKSYILNLLDWLTPSLLLGQIIGRFGNLFNYEAYGYPTTLPWRMFVPERFRPEVYQNINYFHPFFLYEALGNLLILMFLLFWEKKSRKWAPAFAGVVPTGRLFFSYLLLYNVLRFSLEFLRADSTFIYGIRLNAAVSLVLAVVAIGLILFNERSRTSNQIP